MEWLDESASTVKILESFRSEYEYRTEYDFSNLEHIFKIIT